MMKPTGRPGSIRLPALALAAVVFALLLLAKYRQPDTATLQIVAHALTSPAGTDSSLYMNMGERAFRVPGHRIFAVLFFEEHQKFIYPPSSLFLLETLNRMPSPDTAWLVLLLLSWVGTLAVAVLFYRELRGEITLVEVASIIVLGVLFLPLAEALYRGQVQALLTLMWGSPYCCGRRDGEERRVCAALTCAFKPQLALFLLWGALRKEWRFTGVFAATTAVILSASLLHFGLRNNLDYLPVLSYLSRHGEALWANQSMNGLLNRLLRNGDPGSWSLTVYPPYRPVIYLVSTAFTALGVLAGLVLPSRGRWAGGTADLLFFGGVSVIVSPIAWEHTTTASSSFDRIPSGSRGTLAAARWLLLAACTLAMANRLPPLDHRNTGLSSFFGAYLFYAGIAVLGLLAREEHAGRAADTPSLNTSSANASSTPSM